MMNNEDVKPLLHSADADLRRVLEAGAQHEPSPQDLAGLTKKLAAILPPGTLPPTTPSGGPPPPPPPAAPAASGAGGAAKAMLAIGAIGVAAIVGVAVTRSPSSSSPATPITTAAGSVSVSVSDPEPPPPVFPTATTSAEVPPPPPRRVTHSTPPPPPPPETTMLAGAHEQLLKGSPAQALAMTNDHAKAYPNGSMAQEREVIAIEALMKLGRRDEAARRATQFHKSFPQSSHGERIDRLIK
jgi:hypothetical protein